MHGFRFAKPVFYIKGKILNDKNKTNVENRKEDEEYFFKNILNINDIIRFDSEIEYLYYLELLQKKSEGKVRDINIHQSFVLIPEYTNIDGELIQRMDYECDFFYFDIENNKQMCVDVKGVEEPEFVLKRKIFDYIYRDKFKITIMKYSKSTGFVEKSEYKKSRKRVLKLKEENKLLKEKQKAQEKLDKENIKYKNRYNELKAMQKLSSVQRKRLAELDKILNERGIIH